MVENRNYGLKDHWEANDNRKAEHNDIANASSSSMGLIAILVLIVGIAFYIGSFYWEREPLPKITKKHRPAASDTHTFPIPGFEKNQG